MITKILAQPPPAIDIYRSFEGGITKRDGAHFSNPNFTHLTQLLKLLIDHLHCLHSFTSVITMCSEQ